MSAKPRVLYVIHADSRQAPGGVQIYGRQLYDAMRAGGDVEPFLVTRVRSETGHSADRARRFGLADGDPHELQLITRPEEFNPLLWRTADTRLYTEHWRGLLEQLSPDIVHFRHAHGLGYDLIRETRRTLPDTPLIFHLSDFNPMCHHHGQMIRRHTHELCGAASPRRCHTCFPEVSEQAFFLRDRYIATALELIDVFIAPSRFVGQRFAEWGIPVEKIIHEDHGILPAPRLADPADAGHRRRLGFFGQITPYKGLDVLLESVRLLARDGIKVELQVHGRRVSTSNLAFAERLDALLAETADSVRVGGEYAHTQLPELMSAVDWVIVPSLWWEVGPNVIREAWHHGRPVICSNIGSMAERVHDGVDGLHFPVGDPTRLAATIKRAVEAPELWNALRDRIRAPRELHEYVTMMTALYERLLARPAGVRR